MAITTDTSWDVLADAATSRRAEKNIPWTDGEVKWKLSGIDNASGLPREEICYGRVGSKVVWRSFPQMEIINA